MLTPKEKAKELILKYKYHLDIELNNSGNIDLAKLYSLIAVDECLNTCVENSIYYWQDVKKEIEKL
jgi:hypothetical protein